MPNGSPIITWFFRGLVSALLVAGVGACATKGPQWDSRVGTATYDELIREMGPPDKSASLTDGTVVAEWMVARGRTFVQDDPMPRYYRRGGPYVLWPSSTDVTTTPDQMVRLTFGTNQVLQSWKKVYR